jgi:TolB-like protein
MSARRSAGGAEVFVSYARAGEPVAFAVEEALVAEGWRVWRDDQLLAHGRFTDAIGEKLRTTKAVVVVWSADAVKSDWVRAEADAARAAGKLVQLSVDGALPPLPFNQISCANLAGWEGDRQAPGWRKVSESVRQLVGREAPPAAGEALTAKTSKPSLAVLPFANLSRSAGQRYFTDGMMDEIVTALTRIRSLFVIASGATLALRSDELAPGAASHRLGVRYILEGSVRRAGPKVRIAVSLTDMRAEGRIWAERFEDTLDDVFALQDRVALAVAGVIEPAVHTAEANRIARRPLESLGAYDLYLRAAQLRSTLRRAEVFEALDFLERAMRLEPEFAPALAHAAGCHSQILVNGWDDDAETHRREVLRLAHQAAECGADDASALAQAANAVIDLGGHEELAAALSARALALNPGSAFAWFISGLVGIMRGEPEKAIAHLAQATRLDPVSSLHDKASAHIGVGHALLGDWAEAAGVIGQSSFRPPRVRLILVAAYGQLGRLEEARRELEHYKKSCGTSVEAMAQFMSVSLSVDCQKMFFDGIARARGM